MASTSVSSDAAARHFLKTMVRRRLYSLPQWDAKIQWWPCRMFPQTFRDLILHLYRSRLWVFAENTRPAG